MRDVIIIGAGIIGSFIAHNLSKYQLNVLILEKDIDVCNGISKANSAIIHSGYDPLPNTLKAKLNVLGNQMYEGLCNELNVRYKKVGSLTIAVDPLQVNEIYNLFDRAKINGVNVSLKNKDQLLKMEPNLTDQVLLGLYSPSTGIISPWELVYALLENAIYNGVELLTECHVMDINDDNDGFNVITSKGNYTCKYIINATGLNAAKVYEMVVSNPEFKIIPTIGQYDVLDKSMMGFVNHVIYPLPSKTGKGVLVVPTIEGNILLGPTTEVIDKLSTDTTDKGFNHLRDHLKVMMKEVPYQSVIHSFVGIRPKSDQGDFIIEESKQVKNFINVAGIDSPGLASAPAIGNYVVQILLDKENISLNENYKVFKQNLIRVNEMDIIEINHHVQLNHQYGKIVCRCECISEGEVIDSIRRIVGAKTIDGVKRRCRAGMGRCQGGFCQSLILNILANELGVSKLEILLNQPHSNILKG